MGAAWGSNLPKIAKISQTKALAGHNFLPEVFEAEAEAEAKIKVEALIENNQPCLACLASGDGLS